MLRLFGRHAAIALCLVGQALAGTINIEWLAKTYEPLTISAADEVIFTYTAAHNVYKFDNQAAYDDCDFDRASLFGENADKSYRFAPGIPGVFHFGCQVGSHCASSGQKIIITVEAAAGSNSQYSQYGTVMAGSKPQESDYFNAGEEHLTKTFEVTSTIPGDVTTYSYIGWDFDTDKDYHVVGFEAITNNSEFLHHYVLKMCKAHSGGTYNYPGTGIMRDHRQGVHDYQDECYSQIWGWALGVSYFMAPKDTGFLMGQSANAGKALELNVHYDNPLQKQGKSDTSYLKVYYTSTIRAHNLGSLEIGGGGPGQVADIPPNRKHFYNTFGVKCNMPQDITIVGHLSHAHLLGRTIVTEKWELPSSKSQSPKLLDDDYGRDPQFFFDNQHYVSWNNPKLLSNNDYMAITCVFDSRGRTSVTRGGLATQDEMCINFLVYYPNNDQEHCEVIHRKAENMPDWYDSSMVPSNMMSIVAADGWNGYAAVTTTTTTKAAAVTSGTTIGGTLGVCWLVLIFIAQHMCLACVVEA